MLDYPPEETELEIIKKHINLSNNNNEQAIISAIRLANNLRRACFT